MIAEWKPFPEIRPPRTGTYLVCYENGGINFGRYEKYDEENGKFNLPVTRKQKVRAWDFKPSEYKESGYGNNNEQAERD